MRKPLRILLRVLLAIPAFIILLFVGLQLLLNSSFTPKTIDRMAAKMLDARLSYTNVKVSMLRRFPRMSISLDTISITYPHDRFAAWDSAGVENPLNGSGRGKVEDTLMRFDHFSASISPIRFLSGQLRLKSAHLHNLNLYAHSYDSTAANWNVFKSSGKEKDSTSTSLSSTPWISIGTIHIGDKPQVVYTACSDTVFARLAFDELAIRGDVKLAGSDIKFKNILLDLDSLSLSGRLPADSIGVCVPRLDITNPKRGMLHLEMEGEADYLSGNFGELLVPVALSADASYHSHRDVKHLTLSSLEANLAHIPVSANADVLLGGDSTHVDAALKISGCDVGTLISEYGVKVAPILNDVRADAELNFEAAANGCISDGRIPHVTAKLGIRNGRVNYKPMGISARLEIDSDADISPEKYVVADINNASLRACGLKLDLGAKGIDILGDDPRFIVHSTGYASADSLMQFVPDTLGVEARGNVDLSLDADARMSELKTFNFLKSDIKGSVRSDCLQVEMPKDTLALDVDNTRINFASNEKGVSILMDLDSIAFEKGRGMLARIRGMKNAGILDKVVSRGRRVTRYRVSSANDRIFLKSGPHRMGVRGVDVNLAAQKRVRMGDVRRRKLLDSLQRVYPGVPRDSLLIRARRKGGQLPSFLTEKDFEKGDISVSLDSSIMNLWSQWQPSGSAAVRKGFIATPKFPLRTRLVGMALHFSDNDIAIDTLGITSGTSDIGLTGSLKDLRRSMRGRGPMRLAVDVSSGHLNANELLAAYAVGSKADSSLVNAGTSEDDEHFVTDTLADARVKSDSMSLIIVPANVIADINLNAGKVEYSDFVITPLAAKAKMSERCIQIVDTKLSSNYGDIGVDAFYSTRTKKDITAGVNLRLSNVDANGIIHTVPAIGEIVPMLNSFEGKLGCEISATTQLDTCMNIVMPSLDGIVRITGRNLNISDAGDLRKITRLLLFRNKNIGRIEDLSVDAVIHDSHLEVFPFVLGVDRYKMALMGMQGFDKSMNYHVSILKSPIPFRFGINLWGSLDKWKFSLGRAKYQNGKVPVFTQQLDSMQYNIGFAIKNILKKGVNNAMKQNSASIKSIEDRKAELNYDSGKSTDLLTSSEYAQIDSLSFSEDIESMNADLLGDVDSILNDTFSNASKLMSEYEAEQKKKKKK